MDQKIVRMKELSLQLQKAAKAYYQQDQEIISNLEYDRLYDELLKLEQDTGVVLSGSPTVTVGYEAQELLPKERHEAPMLSLEKTKERLELVQFAGDQEVLISWKLDGLTVVLTYRDGKLEKAVTRGNGETGEVITPNARVFQNIPLQIAYQGELILRGEAVITYSAFQQINQEIAETDGKYKNPRNLCSGSVRQLNNEITAKRHVRFYAFSLVRAEDVNFQNSRSYQLEWLRAQGFEVVAYKKVSASGVEAAIEYFAEHIQTSDLPSDGLVVTYDNIAYGQSLGRTAKFPRDSIAFKWQDETAETTLLEIEWSPSRTGLINPVAVFEPVELEGTTVSRASVHNLSVMKSLYLGIGDQIIVYKANMIIPQIAENLTRSGTMEIPCVCPACGQKTELRSINDAEMLYCTNDNCSAKKIKSFTLMVSRDALNIDGLSEATLEKFTACGFLQNYADLFHLDRYRDEIIAMDGFGEKSYNNLIGSIEKARRTTMPGLLCSLGIPNIGVANARVLSRHFEYEFDRIRNCSEEELSEVEGMGTVTAAAVVRFFLDEENRKSIDLLLKELTIEKPEAEQRTQILAGKTFVITGSVEQFANRNELKALIESLGGKTAGSVSKNTDYLINNDTASASSKNKKARELGIPVLSEDDFMALIKED